MKPQFNKTWFLIAIIIVGNIIIFNVASKKLEKIVERNVAQSHMDKNLIDRNL